MIYVCIISLCLRKDWRKKGKDFIKTKLGLCNPGIIFIFETKSTHVVLFSLCANKIITPG